MIDCNCFEWNGPCAGVRSYQELNNILFGAHQRVRNNNPQTFDEKVVDKLPLAPTDASIIEMAEGVGFSQGWTAVAKAARRPKAGPPQSGNIAQMMGLAKAPPVAGPPAAPAASAASAPLMAAPAPVPLVAAPAAPAPPAPVVAAPVPTVAAIPAAPVPPEAGGADDVGGAGDELVCVICMDVISEAEGIQTLPCNHKLHLSRFNDWHSQATNIQNPDHCPMGCHRSRQSAAAPAAANAADEGWEVLEAENMGS